MATQVQGITVDIGGDSTKLAKALKNVNSDIGQVQRALKNVDDLLKKFPDNTVLLDQKTRGLSERVDLLKNKLVLLEEQEKRTYEELKKDSSRQNKYDDIQRQIITTTEALRQAKEDLESFGKSKKSLDDVNGSLKQIDDLLVKLPDNTVLLEQKARNLTDKIDLLENKLAELKAQEKAVGDQLKNDPSQQSKYDEIRRQILLTEDALGETRTELEKLQGTVKNIDDVERNLKDIDALLKEYPDNVTLLDQKARNLTDKIGLLENKLSLLAEQEKETYKQLQENPSQQSKYDEIRRDIIQTEDALKAAREELEQLKNSTRSMDDVEKSLSDINQLLKEMPDNEVLIEQKTRTLTEKIGLLNEKLKKLRDEERETYNQLQEDPSKQSKYDEIQREILATEDAIKKAKAEMSDMAKVNSDIDNVKKRIGDINSVLKDLPESSEMFYQKLKALGEESKLLNDKLKLLREQEKETGDALAEHPELIGEWEKVRREIEATEAELKKVDDEIESMNHTDTWIDKLNASLDNSNGKYAKYREELSQTKTHLNELKEIEKEASAASAEHPELYKAEYQALQDEITATQNKIKELNTEYAKQQMENSSLYKTGEFLKDTGKGLTDVSKKLLPVSAGLIGIGKGAVDAAASFETAFTGVKKTVDEDVNTSYEALAENIKQMATETASSAEDIARVMEVSGQLGITGTDNLTTFTKTMVMLGDTTNITAEDAAESLARFINITGDSQSNIDKIGSAIVDLGNNFATNEDEIVKMSTRLASAGTIAGLSSTDILGMATAMSQVGIKAEAGGTAMTQTLNAIIKAVDGANGETNGLVETINGLNIQLDETKAGQGMNYILSDMARLFSEGATEADVLAYAVEQYGLSVEDAGNMTASMVDYVTGGTASFEDMMWEVTALETDMSNASVSLEEGLATMVDMLNSGATVTDTATWAMENFGTGAKDTGKILTKVQSYVGDVSGAYDTLSTELGDSTSKLQLIADLSGMTAEEFAAAWKSDPITALESFIRGLGNLDEESESTTVILEKLGMSGVRQSNMLRALSLSADKMTEAVETSNTAYYENNALVKEANKRYDTFDTKVNQAKERIKQSAASIGEKLIPVVEDVLDFADKLLDKWDDLDEDTQESIIKMGLVTAAASPVLGVIGSVTSGIGGLLKGTAGLVSDLKNLPSIASKTSESLTGIGGVIGKLAGSGAGGLLGVGALLAGSVGVIVGVAKEHEKAIQEAYDTAYEEASKFSDKQQELVEKAKSMTESIDRMKEQSLLDVDNAEAEIAYAQNLWSELSTIVDENGKIKAGYEDRAEVIATLLSDSLGVELELQEGVITNYTEIANSIDKVIEKKKLDAYITAYADDYKEALSRQNDALRNSVELENELTVARDNVSAASSKLSEEQQKLNELQEKFENGGSQHTLIALTFEIDKQREAVASASGEWQGAIDVYNELSTQLENSKEDYADYTNTITNYEELLSSSVSDNTDDIQASLDRMKIGFVDAATATENQLTNQVANTAALWESLKQQYEDGSSSVNKTQVDSMKDMVYKSIEELAKLDSGTATKLSELRTKFEEQADEMEDLGYSSFEDYMVQSITAMTNKGADLSNTISAIVSSPLQSVATNAATWADHLVSNFASTLTSPLSLGKLSSAASAAAGSASNPFRHTVPKTGPFKDELTWMPHFIGNMATGIEDNAWRLEEASDYAAETIAARMSGVQATLPGSDVSQNAYNYNSNLGGVSIVINAAPGQDVEQIADAVSERIADQYGRMEAIYAK